MRALCVAVLLWAGCVGAQAQGCSQCRETVGQTPARTQTAYRRAILLLVGAGAAVFGAGVVVARKYR